MKKTIAMTFGALIGTSALMLAQPPPEASPGKRPPKGELGEGRQMRPPPATPEEIKEFDKDGDGKLDKEEHKALVDKRRAEHLKKYDTDGDGKLSDEEKAKAREDRRKAAEENRKKRMERFDTDGDGKVSDAERAKARESRQKNAEERRKKLVEKYDKDGDGKLSEEERKEIKSEGRPRGLRGPGGPGGRRGGRPAPEGKPAPPPAEEQAAE